MKRRVQDYWCPHCTSRTGHLIELEDDVPNSMDSCPQEMPCHTCGNLKAYRVFSVPRLMTRGAVPDGTDRGDHWRLHKEKAKVESESLNLPHDKRLQHHKEMQRLDERASKVSARNKTAPLKGNA